MRTVLATLALSALAVVTGAALVLYSGIIDVGADDPHSAPLHAVLETARERAVAVRARDIEVPPLGSAEQMRSGAGNYAAMCVGCHLAPGVAPTELSQGLYPAPACRRGADSWRTTTSGRWSPLSSSCRHSLPWNTRRWWPPATATSTAAAKRTCMITAASIPARPAITTALPSRARQMRRCIGIPTAVVTSTDAHLAQRFASILPTRSSHSDSSRFCSMSMPSASIASR